MKDLPYMKWYPSDFDSDEAVKLMTLEELGFYLKCLNHAWVNSGLPGSIDLIAKLFSLSREKAESLWAIVGAKFELLEGRYWNPRQLKDSQKASSISQKRSVAGKIGANAKHLPEFCLSKQNQLAAVRAYDSDSNYESNSSSEKESEEPTEKELDEFSVWASETHLAHPNSYDKYQSVQALTKRFSRDPEAKALFSRNHALWLQTEKWRDKQGSFAPRLWKWIEDDGWKKPPPGAPKKESAIDRIVREEMEKKANASR